MREQTMASSDLAIWLEERTALGVLSEEILEAIAQVLEEKVVSAQTRLVVEDTPPEGIYILKQGQLEGDRINQTGSVWSISLLPGAIVHLQELLFGQLAQRTIIALSE